MTNRSMMRIVFDNLPKITAQMRAEARLVVGKAADDAKVVLIASMRGPKTGRTYRRGRVGKRMTKARRAAGLKAYTTKKGTEMAIVGYKFHRASAPGESPAIDLGDYANSWGLAWAGPLTRILYTDAEQAMALEYGRPEKNLAPRPHLKPALEAVMPGFLADMQRVIHD